MDNEQDPDMDPSDGSLAGSRNPPYAMIEDSFTSEEIDSILEGTPKSTVADHMCMNEERSKHSEWKSYEGAAKLTKQMNALLSFCHEEKKRWADQQTAASNTAKSLKRPRSSGNGRENGQDHSVNNPETDVNDAETGADDIFTSFMRIKRPDRPQAILHR
jgi:hypothetical protein